jgi:hypothetical protein
MWWVIRLERRFEILIFLEVSDPRQLVFTVAVEGDTPYAVQFG